MVGPPVGPPGDLPSWAMKATHQIRGLTVVMRQLLVLAMCVAAFAFIGWIVTGMVAGFVSLPTIVGVSGLTGLAETARRFVGHPDPTDGPGSA